MDRTAVTVGPCLSMSRSSGRGFAGGGWHGRASRRRPRSCAGQRTPECGSMQGPPATRLILPLLPTAAAHSSNRTGGAPGAASRSQRISERRGDRSMGARLRVPHAGAGRHPLCFCTYHSPAREGRGIPERIRMRMVQDGEMMRVAAAVQDASESRHAQEAGAWRCADATGRRWRGCSRCAFTTCGLRLARGSHRAKALSRQCGVM